MKIPGFKTKKTKAATERGGNGSSIYGDQAYSEGSHRASQEGGLPTPTLRSRASNTNLSELGALGYHEKENSLQPATTGKRSFFKRGHSHSVSSSSSNALEQASVKPQPATISPAAGHSPHPLRQQTLPADLEPPKPQSKRPLLSFPKRASSLMPLTAPSLSAGSPSSQVTAAPIGWNAPNTVTGGAITAGPYSDNGHATSSESFALKSFRSVTAVREDVPKPTLSSLVERDSRPHTTPSPFSSRPGSPSPSVGSASYFDNVPGAGPVIIAHGHERTTSGSISVAKFREAKAVRTASSTGGTPRGDSPSAYTAGGAGGSGLKLDLPAPSTFDLQSSHAVRRKRPSLSSSQTAPPIEELAYRQPESKTTAPTTRSSSARALSSPPAHQPLSPIEPDASSVLPYQRSPSLEGDATMQAVSPRSALASHPDNALPLPPVPMDPSAIRPPYSSGHSRRDSTHSITSLSSAIGGWLNTSNIGLAFNYDDVVQKATSSVLNASTSVLPSSMTASAASAKPHVPKSPKVSEARTTQENGEEVLEPPSKPFREPRSRSSSVGSTSALSQAELSELLGGKILPPPPSETGHDDFAALPGAIASAAIGDTSQTSNDGHTSFGTLSPLATAKNLFSSVMPRPAKPARDDTSSDSETSETDVAHHPNSQRQHAVNHTSPRRTTGRKLFGSSDSDSDEDPKEDSTSDSDSDDSNAERKRLERARVFPPPRPTTAQERERVYKSAQTTPAISPVGSHADLRTTFHLHAAPVSARVKGFRRNTVIDSSLRLQPLVQPVPRLAPLTANALENLNAEEDEDVPLSTVARNSRSKAMSEFGLPVTGRPMASTTLPGSGSSSSVIASGGINPYGHMRYASSSLAVGGSNAAPKVSSKLAPTSRAVSSNSGSLGMAGRSLSSFSTTGSELNASGASQRSMSASALPTLANSQDFSPSAAAQVTLSSLIAAEMAMSASPPSAVAAANPSVSKHTAQSLSTSSCNTSVGPSSSSDSSFPKTPSDLSTAPAQPRQLKAGMPHPSFNKDNLAYRKHGHSMSEFGMMSSGLGNDERIRKSSMQSAQSGGSGNSAGGAGSTVGSTKHGRTSSVPLVKLSDEATQVHDRMKARHKEEARKSGVLYGQGGPAHAQQPPVKPSAQAFTVAGPPALQTMPCPPGVDPILYASCECEPFRLDAAP